MMKNVDHNECIDTVALKRHIHRRKDHVDIVKFNNIGSDYFLEFGLDKTGTTAKLDDFPAFDGADAFFQLAIEIYINLMKDRLLPDNFSMD